MATRPTRPSRIKRRIDPAKTLDYTVATRLSTDEIEQIKAMAERDGLSVSQWLRAAAIGTASLPDSPRQQLMTTAGMAT
jgi:hypothetical protein